MANVKKKTQKNASVCTIRSEVIDEIKAAYAEAGEADGEVTLGGNGYNSSEACGILRWVLDLLTSS